MNSQIMAPVSIGELLDKISILEIKMEKISDPEKRKNIKFELELLQKTADEFLTDKKTERLTQLYQELKSHNESLWKIEDDIRDKEREKSFDQEFIELARSVYFTNDKRAARKKDINLLLGSLIVEEKSYKAY